MPPIDDPASHQRVVIEAIQPQVDAGRFPIKRVIGETVTVEADVFADGHGEVVARLLWRHSADAEWHIEPMLPIGNDRWRASFRVTRIGRYDYQVEGCVDRLGTWIHDFARRAEAGQDLAVELLIGAGLVDDVADRATEPREATRLQALAAHLRDVAEPQAARTKVALDPRLIEMAAPHPDLAHATRSEPALSVVVDRQRALFSTWYELFPRSTAEEAGRHGTFRDVIDRLPYVAGMGFDVLYLPPIHPIGTSFRKGPDDALVAGPTDPGVPWAIGGPDGGHTDLQPELGTMDDFRALVSAAHELGLEIALDIAFQASPDHPWVTEHPTWFKHRPDGTVQYAENPPKRYQDIYPFDFDSEDWPALWEALLRVMTYWAGEGVRILRVDNPHTKPFAFWEWAITRLKADYPDVILLAEAFTRPRVMERLAKLGFSQSYTYFTWRTTKGELTAYLTELMSTEVSEFLRPNLWPNTPDILHETLQVGGRPGFEARLVLAATLASSYGIYGPPFELMESVPREPGSEEYLHSEKYQLRHWDLTTDATLGPMITRLNEIRRQHPALQANDGLRFHRIDGERLIAYSKRTPDGSDAILTVVNLDPDATAAGMIDLDLEALGLDETDTFDVHDLLDGATYRWTGGSNYIELEPGHRQAHVFEIVRVRP